jgi:hypothetical protein
VQCQKLPMNRSYRCGARTRSGEPTRVQGSRHGAMDWNDVRVFLAVASGTNTRLPAVERMPASATARQYFRHLDWGS